mmetsp:Transcript_13953/g.29629  ORF Transcript_13953/g.29629 Transcript_13953/m.29629 type:complete len:86 (+) Transcript_13953:419-676(+)
MYHRLSRHIQNSTSLDYCGNFVLSHPHMLHVDCHSHWIDYDVEPTAVVVAGCLDFVRLQAHGAIEYDVRDYSAFFNRLLRAYKVI